MELMPAIAFLVDQEIHIVKTWRLVDHTCKTLIIRSSRMGRLNHYKIEKQLLCESGESLFTLVTQINSELGSIDWFTFTLELREDLDLQNNSVKFSKNFRMPV